VPPGPDVAKAASLAMSAGVTLKVCDIPIRLPHVDAVPVEGHQHILDRGQDDARAYIGDSSGFSGTAP